MLLKVKRVIPQAYEIYYKGQNIVSLVRPKRNWIFLIISAGFSQISVSVL